MEKQYRYGRETIKLEITRNSDTVTVSAGDRTASGEIRRISGNEWMITRDGGQDRIFMAADREGVLYVHACGSTYRLEPLEDSFQAGDASGGASDGRLIAAMPGKLIKVMVKQGDSVQKGQPVLILESMKMENTQEAPFDGTVSRIEFEVGAQVDAGKLIMLLEPAETG